MIQILSGLCGMIGLVSIGVVEPSSTMIEVQSAQAILQHVDQLSPQTLVLIDVDNTLITPVSKAFRVTPNLIDDIKKKKNNTKNFVDLLSHWRLQRKTMLVDSDWPTVLSTLKKKHALVYGLTKMETGSFGVIPSMEQWRYAELKSLNLEFSDNQALQKHSDQIAQGSPNSPVFYRGILMTGSASKSEVLKLFQPFFAMDQILMIDDRLDQLEEVRTFCKIQSIPFLGIFFQGMTHFREQANPVVVAFQRDYLIKHGQWLEDEAAIALMKASSKS